MVCFCPRFSAPRPRFREAGPPPPLFFPLFLPLSPASVPDAKIFSPYGGACPTRLEKTSRKVFSLRNIFPCCRRHAFPGPPRELAVPQLERGGEAGPCGEFLAGIFFPPAPPGGVQPRFGRIGTGFRGNKRGTTHAWLSAGKNPDQLTQGKPWVAHQETQKFLGPGPYLFFSCFFRKMIWAPLAPIQDRVKCPFAGFFFCVLRQEVPLSPSLSTTILRRPRGVLQTAHSYVVSGFNYRAAGWR